MARYGTVCGANPRNYSGPGSVFERLEVMELILMPTRLRVCFLRVLPVARGYQAQLPTSELNRPILAHFDAVARRITKDHAGSFCT